MIQCMTCKYSNIVLLEFAKYIVLGHFEMYMYTNQTILSFHLDDSSLSRLPLLSIGHLYLANDVNGRFGPHLRGGRASPQFARHHGRVPPPPVSRPKLPLPRLGFLLVPVKLVGL